MTLFTRHEQVMDAWKDHYTLRDIVFIWALIALLRPVAIDEAEAKNLDGWVCGNSSRAAQATFFSKP